MTVVEPCLSYEIRRGTRNLRLQAQQRKCLFLYHYQIHPTFGFMHARIQTWFRFSIQVCINGQEWLARMMDAAGLRYVRRENCFTWLENPEHAQRLMDQQVQAAWPDLLNRIARSLNPLRDDVPGVSGRVLLVDLSERVGHRHPLPRSGTLARLPSSSSTACSASSART